MLERAVPEPQAMSSRDSEELQLQRWQAPAREASDGSTSLSFFHPGTDDPPGSGPCLKRVGHLASETPSDGPRWLADGETLPRSPSFPLAGYLFSRLTSVYPAKDLKPEKGIVRGKGKADMYYAMNTYILEREKRWFERVRERWDQCASSISITCRRRRTEPKIA